MSSSAKPDSEEAFVARLAAPAKLVSAVRETLEELLEKRFADRLFARDHTLWRDDPAEISNRLGWLSVVNWMLPRGEEIQRFADALRARGVRDVVLLGMGGSSLAPEVFRRVFGSAPGSPTLHVLDTTSPAWIRRVSTALDPRHLHILVASKSGTTIEVRTLRAHFTDFVLRAGVSEPGGAFSAITDPDTRLDALSTERGFFQCFRNPSDIGGRYSALSYFGLVPAATLGIEASRLLEPAREMMTRCEDSSRDNPGLALGALLGAAARAGRDKMTLLFSPRLEAFGLWIEQLVAESTGKDGTGIVPVLGEPHLDAPRFGEDRVFVAIRALDDPDVALDARVDELVRAGHPVYRIDLPDLRALGAEMVRWEVATVVAGHLLGIQPFDQPDVQSAKTSASRILEALTAGEEPPSAEGGDARALLANLGPGDYVGFMVYGDPSPEYERALDDVRRVIGETYGVATTVGIGPRFLHSTGQLHKGGGTGGVFVQVVLPEEDLPIPGESFGFRDLMEAQAGGDLAALRDAGKRVARVEAPDPAALRSLAENLR